MIGGSFGDVVFLGMVIVKDNIILCYWLIVIVESV